MSIALRILAICTGLGVGVLLAIMLIFGGPNYYGLRPHAVKAGLKSHDVGALLALGKNGPVTGILTYDAWYKGRDGQTGWFLLPLEQARDLEFAVNGALDPALADVFGAAPRRCNDTGLSEKLVRVVEPDREDSGFLGRSTCKRSTLDIAEIIAASQPAHQREAWMTHAELTAFDAARDPKVLRDNVRQWPTPYAFDRTITLPLIWQSTDLYSTDVIFQMTKLARSRIAELTREGHVSLKLQAQDWDPQFFKEITPHQLPLRQGGKTVFIRGITFRLIYIDVLCAPDARAACDAVDLGDLTQATLGYRDQAVLESALKTARPLPDQIMGLRGVLDVRRLERIREVAPTSEERRFDVVWYDSNSQGAPNQ